MVCVHRCRIYTTLPQWPQGRGGCQRTIIVLKRICMDVVHLVKRVVVARFMYAKIFILYVSPIASINKQTPLTFLMPLCVTNKAQEK